MDSGMQSLDATIHDFGETGVSGHINDRDASQFEETAGASCGKDFESKLYKSADKDFETGFVTDADEGSARGYGGHGCSGDVVDRRIHSGQLLSHESNGG
jgi:hypothetical protein